MGTYRKNKYRIESDEIGSRDKEQIRGEYLLADPSMGIYDQAIQSEKQSGVLELDRRTLLVGNR